MEQTSRELIELMLGAGAVAMAATSLCTPAVRRLALRLNLVDRPNHRSIHHEATPTLGGLAILGGILVGCVIFAPLDVKLAGLLLAGTLLAFVGAIDDALNLSPLDKLLAMVAAALLLCRFGVVIDGIALPFGGRWVDFGPWAWPITVLWIVGVINAVNFIDGVDGLAAGVSAISAGTIGVLAAAWFIAERQPAIAEDHRMVAVVGVAVAGSCLGFLRWNFHPAQIFMGDAGSQLLGLTLAGLSIIGLFKTALLFIVPIVVLGLPLMDITWVVVRRTASGRPAYVADQGHIHHRLLARGISQRWAVLILYGVSAVLAVSAYWLGRP